VHPGTQEIHSSVASVSNVTPLPTVPTIALVSSSVALILARTSPIRPMPRTPSATLKITLMVAYVHLIYLKVIRCRSVWHRLWYQDDQNANSTSTVPANWLAFKTNASTHARNYPLVTARHTAASWTRYLSGP